MVHRNSPVYCSTSAVHICLQKIKSCTKHGIHSTNPALHKHIAVSALGTEMLPANNYRGGRWGFPITHILTQQQLQSRATMFTSIFGFCADTTNQTASNCCVGQGRVYFYCDHLSSETILNPLAIFRWVPKEPLGCRVFQSQPTCLWMHDLEVKGSISH